MLQQDGLFLDKHHELYEKLVPQHNKLRRLLELQDKYCLDNGRNAISPIALIKYIVLKNIYKLSDVDIVERTMYDLSIKYFLGMVRMTLS